MKDNIKKELEDREKVSEYEKLKKEYYDLEKEEKDLKDYLNLNVFDYAQNSQKIDDIFTVKSASVNFFEQTKDCKNINFNFPVLEISNLTKYYSSKKVPSLVNVTIKVYFGDLHVVVGTSGSGKTTLFNCLNGLEDYEGSILVDGKELNENSSELRNNIGFVPADFNWELYSTVENVITNRFLELEMTEVEAQNYIRSALENLNISYLRNFPVIELSLLEKKKIQIIIALITKPSIVVLDELFLGLQQHECLELLGIFQKLKRDNRAFLAFSYNFNDFSKFANTISILSDGKLFYTGTVENLFLAHKNRYSILTSNNKEALNALDCVKCKYEYHESINTIYAEFDGKLNLSSFQRECVNRNVIIYELKSLETSLQDLYPVLKKEGTPEAIKFINTFSFFEPN